MANESPIAPTERTIHAVNREPRGTARWRIEVDAVHAMAFELLWAAT